MFTIFPPYAPLQILAEVSTNLGAPMVGISDIKADPTNFRDREGGDVLPITKKQLVGVTETQLYGSSWKH